MHNESFQIAAGLLHVEWFMEHGEERAGVLRFFRHPLAPLDALTGQPKGAYEWCCTLHQKGGILHIKGVLALPELTVVNAMIRTARRLKGAPLPHWEWLDQDGWLVTKTVLAAQPESPLS